MTLLFLSTPICFAAVDGRVSDVDIAQYNLLNQQCEYGQYPYLRYHPPSYDLAAHLESGKSYKWQIVAKNVMGESESQVWSFTTKAASSSHLRELILILKVLAGVDEAEDDLGQITDTD